MPSAPTYILRCDEFNPIKVTQTFSVTAGGPPSTCSCNFRNTPKLGYRKTTMFVENLCSAKEFNLQVTCQKKFAHLTFV